MRAECPASHASRVGTHAQCGDCPMRQRHPLRELPAATTTLDMTPVPLPAQPAAEAATRDAHLPGQITTRARDEAQRIIDLSLEEAERVLTRHVAWPSRAALDTILMWLCHANARERDDKGMPGPLIWSVTPRLLLTSAVNGSGKSTGLTLIARLAGSRFGRQSSITAPGYAAMISQFNEPVILDDVANIFGRGEGHRLLQTHILNGYTPDVITFDARKGGTARNLFGVVAYAGKDDLITASMSGSITDLLSRSIVIRMKRPSRYYLDIDDAARASADLAQRGMARWSYVLAPELRLAAARLSQEAADAGELAQSDVDGGMLRKVQLYRPLIACADVIGGDWPARMRAASSSGSDLGDILADLAASALGPAGKITFTDE